MSIVEEEKRENRIGIAYAAGSYLIWGILPIYWKFVEHIPASEILAHRIIWSFVFVMALILFTNKTKKFVHDLKKLLTNKIALLGVITSSFLISTNWYLFIWAVNSGHIIETSLGYYINPLISFLLAVIVLKERLVFWQIVSFVLAGIGVLILTVQYGSFPWVAITLALSFGLYGLTKKLTKLDSLTGLTLETMIVTPVALIYVLFFSKMGIKSFTSLPTDSILLLLGAGIVTALPLLLFSSGAKRIPLSMVGILQYIAPTISLALGVFLYNEHFTKTHIVTFSFIWVAILIYSFSKSKLFTSMQPKIPNNKSLGA